MTVTALFEVVGVLSISPFVLSLSNPAALDDVVIVGSLMSYLQLMGNQKIIFLGCVFLAMNLLGNSLIIIGHALYNKFSMNLSVELSEIVIRKRLSDPLPELISTNRHDIVAKSIHETQQVAVQYVAPFLRILSRVFVLVLLVSVILISFPLVSLLLGGFVFLAYLGIFTFLKTRIAKHGARLVEGNRARVRIANEIFEAVKEVKIWGLEDFWVQKYLHVSKAAARSQVFSMLFAQSPYYIVESLSFIGILLAVSWIVISQGGFVEALSSIGLLVFVGYKLIPAMQQIYNATVAMKSVEAVFVDISRYVLSGKNEGGYAENGISIDRIKKVELSSLRYQLNDKDLYSGLDFIFQDGCFVAITGESGSGKSTLINIILGFSVPSSGCVRVNDHQLMELDYKSYLSQVAYVPQKPMLFDSSIKENIILNQPFDSDRFEYVLKVSMLDKFLEDLPNGYESPVGFGGQLLSGGQAHRVAIARALYKQASMLVMDEPTSALDANLERQLMNNIKKYAPDLIKIIVTHSENIKSCADIILEMK